MVLFEYITEARGRGPFVQALLPPELQELELLVLPLLLHEHLPCASAAARTHAPGRDFRDPMHHSVTDFMSRLRRTDSPLSPVFLLPPKIHWSRPIEDRPQQ